MRSPESNIWRQQYMPGGLGSGCGFNLGDAASYFPCASWLWPEGKEEEGQHMLQAPTQNLAEALIPPMQPDISQRSGDGEDGSHTGREQSGHAWDQGATSPGGPGRGSGQPTSKQKRLNAVRQSARPPESEGIELKTTESNLLLGQAHLQSGGKFVAAQPGRKQNVHASGTTSIST